MVYDMHGGPRPTRSQPPPPRTRTHRSAPHDGRPAASMMIMNASRAEATKLGAWPSRRPCPKIRGLLPSANSVRFIGTSEPTKAYLVPSRTVEVGSTRWLRLETLTYIDRHGMERTWDRCVRAGGDGLSESNTVDAVAVLAVLEGGLLSHPETILVKQFRPPAGAYTVELPAGLVDAGESPVEAAVRELREETGLVAEASDCTSSQPLLLSPGLSSENMVLVRVHVNMGRPENQPQAVAQDLDEGEDIDLVRCPLDQLLPTLQALQRDGVHVFAGLYTLALGMAAAGSSIATPRL